MNEYVVVETPSTKTRLGFRKSASRFSEELSTLLNAMSGEDWEYCGDKMDGKLMVFSRAVPVLNEENQSEVARSLVTKPLDAPIVIRRPRPANLVNEIPAEFQSRQTDRAAQQSGNIVAISG